MISRREFFVAATAAATLVAGTGVPLSRLSAEGRLTQDDLLAFEPVGNVTLVHVTDLHAQLVPIHFREPSANFGVGESRGRVPHLVGAEFRRAFKLTDGSALAYALTADDFEGLARAYGAMGGLDRIATVVKAVRAERGDRMLLLDGGDTWTNSWTSLQTKGQDMADAMRMLKTDAMTAHWEFTLGEARVRELADGMGFPLLAQNIREAEFEEHVFEASRIFERNGVKIGVVGQAFPYTPISNPRWMIPNWTFGIREKELAAEIESLRTKGADLIVLLSHNGFDVDRKVAERVPGIDVILSAHTHDAVPEVTQIGRTLLVASGSNGKFVSRLDLDVQSKRVASFRYRLIPIFSDAITPDAEMKAHIEAVREPFQKDLSRVLGTTDGLLYRRGNFDGTLDTLICDSIIEQRDVEISLSPGVRWGPSMLPGAPITFEDITNATAMSYPACYRTTMTGARLKEVLEDVADNIFNPDPYYQQGGDMVRCGGLGYAIDIAQPAGQRISNLTALRTGAPIDASKEYTVGGWASVNEGTEGPPIWDVVSDYITSKKVVSVRPSTAVNVKGV
ncbi:thiosulfohydrolase SoxB [Hyphomicrobium sp. DMF-1]|jgi:sulfur-oxidizing protein SoxB|uniref:thiosulfohydrolase SoxB n=1 Tax=Hyphomicrobium sp. DMF-1 TaxID=3019544 RepID=UPI0022EBF920|nr:thiosulfohydrolase SoxB [Hyphomicrobium sp. DMF-1]WBT37221.1 thiosulfohydrolase SoxB [Hyphomicrobium sp. DMF-1]